MTLDFYKKHFNYIMLHFKHVEIFKRKYMQFPLLINYIKFKKISR